MLTIGYKCFDIAFFCSPILAYCSQVSPISRYDDTHQSADNRVRDEGDEGTELVEDTKHHQHDPQQLPQYSTGYLQCTE